VHPDARLNWSQQRNTAAESLAEVITPIEPVCCYCIPCAWVNSLKEERQNRMMPSGDPKDPAALAHHMNHLDWCWLLPLLFLRASSADLLPI